MDKIEKIGSSVIQHGKVNDRVYLMHLSKKDAFTLPDQLVKLAEKNQYTKIFAKVPSSAVQHFQKREFFKEAHIPDFFDGQTGMYCVSKFFDPDRAEIPLNDRLEIHKIIQLTKTRRDAPEPELQKGVTIRLLTKEEIPALTHLYKTVFKSYPFPIFEDDYIKETMDDNVVYFGAFAENALVAASSSEMDFSGMNAEMTDFATHPEFRSQNIALSLLHHMEKEMQQRGIKMAYTIARALSAAMNITFAKAGYYFAGTLKNNTNIGGRIESMNVWYKSI